MKKTISLATFLFLIAFTVSAQIKPLVAEMPIQYQGSKIDGFKTTIPFVKPDVVQKAWIKAIEKGTRSKSDIYDTYDISLYGANIKDISDSSMNVFSRIEASDSMVYLFSAFEMQPNDYVNSSNYSPETALAKLFLFEFAKEQYKESIEDELKVEENKLKDLERDLDRAVKDKEKMERDIAGYNNKILEAKNEIMNLENDLQMKQEAINNQKTKVNSIPAANKDAKKEAESVLKDQERDKKKIFRDIEKLRKDIVDYENDIQQNRINIQSNLSQQAQLAGQIQEQAIIVQAVEVKLSNLMDMSL